MSSSLSGYRGPAGSMQGQNMAGSNISGLGIQGNKIPKGHNTGQLQQFTPEQMQLFQQMFGQVGPNSYLSKLAGGDQDIFNQIEAPAFEQFNELLGQNAARFSGMGGQGSLGARKGSGFSNTTNQATSSFAQQLQAQRQGLMRQAQQDLFGMSQSLLNQRPYDQFLEKKQQEPSFWERLLGGAAPLAGAAVGGYFGGIPGAKLGGNLGGKFGQAFM